ncbi:hypothetical protein NHX12_009060 [Muraenolepis orangiensis]|uniref:G-protein coupled receptors family 3 profile domain-containing protein n=1 Tax=Muraenolepis orangiensis TaxID=630683 RepID=A0A9Q0DMK3_9TELE|nr:hypothetical protein NHX12_009060 [Muraenolepis orangiensis]
MMWPLSDLRTEGVSGAGASSECVTLGNSEQLALHSEGDVIIGGLFPMHYLVPDSRSNYHNKPQNLPCNGLQVSYFATCACLTDKRIYPSFLRTVPSDLFQVRGLVELVTYFGWNWVGTVGTPDDYSRYGIQAFAHQFGQRGGCLAYHLTISQSPTMAEIGVMADTLQSSSAKVVVAFATEGQLLELFSELAARNVTGIQWLLHYLKMVNFTNQFGEKVHFDHNGEPVPLYDIINWQKDNKGEIRFIKVGSYDGSVPMDHQLQLNQSKIVWTGGLSQVPVSLCSEPCSPGSRQARRPGESQCCFDCLPCAEGEISNQTDSTECTKCPDYYWSDKRKAECVAGVDDFLSVYDTMGIILITLTLLGVAMTTVITVVFHHFRATPIVRANNSEISFLLLVSLKLCFLCSLAFIGKPSMWTCRLRQAAFGVSFVLCLSCLLVKTIVVLLAFRSTMPGSGAMKLFGASQQRALILCTTAPQVCLCAGWLSGAPPFPFRNPAYQASTGKIVVECRDPWPPGFYLILGYIGLLAFLCLLLAFLGRKLPDTFNEAKLITFSMVIFCAVWLSFIPAHVSSPGKFTVAVEIFAILASSFGLLLCIFLPKCFIILVRPEKNVKKHMIKSPR